MTTEQLADALLIIAEPVGRLMEDEKLIKYIDSFGKKNTGKTMLAVISDALTSALPLLLKDHREDIYKIISALTGKSIMDIRNQPGVRTIMDVRQIWDKDLQDFFTQFAASAR